MTQISQGPYRFWTPRLGNSERAARVGVGVGTYLSLKKNLLEKFSATHTYVGWWGLPWRPAGVHRSGLEESRLRRVWNTQATHEIKMKKKAQMHLACYCRSRHTRDWFPWWRDPLYPQLFSTFYLLNRRKNLNWMNDTANDLEHSGFFVFDYAYVTVWWRGAYVCLEIAAVRDRLGGHCSRDFWNTNTQKRRDSGEVR